MNGTAPHLSWWDDPHTDWNLGAPGRVADILAAAYPDAAAIQSLADSAGVDGTTSVTPEPARQVSARLLGVAATKGRVLDLVAEVLQDNSSEPFHALLRSLLGDHHLGLVDVRRSRKFGLDARSADGADPVVTSICSLASEPGAEPVGSLQALASVPDGLDDPRALVQGLLDAMRRTAMIEIGGQPRGTGFLVGPDLLLTAAHVIDPRHWPPPGSLPEDVCARFDFDSQFERSLTDTGIRVPVAEFVAASLPTAEEVAGNVVDWDDTPADRLDFALLRLGFSVPSVQVNGASQPRGVYALDKSDYDFGSGPMLFIVQHPLGIFQKVSFIRTAAQRNAPGTRIKYGGNTLAGSSGSAVIDLRGRLVAVHHYSQSRGNYGVPVSVIARTLASEDFKDLFSTAAGQLVATAAGSPVDRDPFVTTSLAGMPFVNRGNLRGHIRDMAEKVDGSRLLTIRGEPGSGMSYSYRFLSHVAGRSKAYSPLRQVAPDGLAAVPLDLAYYLGLKVEDRAHRIMCDLLEELGLPHPGEPSAQPAYHASTLPRLLRKGLRDSQRQWWIFLDGVNDLNALKPGDVYEVVSALATVATDSQIPLRLVVVGLEAAAFAASRNFITQEDTAAGLVRGEVEAWFRARATEEGCAIDEDRLARTLTELFPPDGPLPAPRSLAPRLPKRLLEILEENDGS